MKSALMEMTLKDTDYERKSDFERDFKFNRKLKDPRFGEVSLIQNPKSRQFLAVKEKRINDKKEAGKAIINARKRLGNKHPNVLNLVDYSVTKQSELCSSFYVLKLFYDFPKSDLHREVQERAKKGETFSDIELTHILYQQIAANNYLQSKDAHHGDIQPLNIAYDRQAHMSQLIDLSDDAATANATKQVQKNKVVAGQPLYLTPATYGNLKKGNLNYTVDPTKEDVYALGLSLLEVGNGQSIQNIYNANNKEVDQVALQKHVDEFKRRFGNENNLLTTTVETMVHPDESQRPTFRDFESKLPPYSTVQQFLKDRQENRVTGALNNNSAFGAQTISNAGNGQQNNFGSQQNNDWNFGANNGNQYSYVQEPQQYQARPENIQLVNLPTGNNFGSSHNNNLNNSGFGSNAHHKAYAGNDVPIQYNNDNKVVLLSNEPQGNNYQHKGHFEESYTNTTQPSYNQVNNITHAPVIRRSYANVDHSYTSYPNTSYTVDPNVSHSYTVNTEPRVEYITLEPEYRREYVTMTGERTVDAPVISNVIPKEVTRKSYVTVASDAYSLPQQTVHYTNAQPQTVHYSNVQPQTVHYSTPITENVTYAQPATQVITRRSIRRSYAALPTETIVTAPTQSYTTYTNAQPQIVRYSTPHTENVTYTTAPTQTVHYTTPHTENVTYTQPATQVITRRSIRRSYAALPTETVVTAPSQTYTTYTNAQPQTVTYSTPHATEYKNYSYGVPQETVVRSVNYNGHTEPHYVSERVVEHPVSYESKVGVHTSYDNQPVISSESQRYVNGDGNITYTSQ